MPASLVIDVSQTGLRITWPVTRLVVLLLVSNGSLCGQKPAPVLESVFPPGGQAGQTVDVIVTGEELEGATGLMFSTKEHQFTISAEVLPSSISP